MGLHFAKTAQDKSIIAWAFLMKIKIEIWLKYTQKALLKEVSSIRVYWKKIKKIISNMLSNSKGVWRWFQNQNIGQMFQILWAPFLFFLLKWPIRFTIIGDSKNIYHLLLKNLVDPKASEFLLLTESRPGNWFAHILESSGHRIHQIFLTIPHLI